jgi:hypothetical protein
VSKKRTEPTQHTPEGKERTKLGLPGEGGNEIPVPKRDDFMKNMEKAAPPADKQHDD